MVGLGKFHPSQSQRPCFDKDLDSAQCKDEHISVGRVNPFICCPISCCIKCMQDNLRVCFFLVTLQIRHLSLGPLAFAAIGYYSSGSISFCVLVGLFCQVLCQFILCFSMGKKLFHSDFSDERRWDDSVIDKVLLSLSLQVCRSKISRVSSLSPYFSEMRLMKRSARCEQLHICSGLSRACTSAIASMTDTLIPVARDTLAPSQQFYSIFSIWQLLQDVHQCTHGSKFVCSDSFLYAISGRFLQITIITENRFLSSCNFTVSPVHGILILLAMDSKLI